MDATTKTIIDVLLEKNRLTNSEAAEFSKSLGNEEIEKKLRAKNLVSSEDIAKAYAVVYDLPFIRLENYDIKPESLQIIPKDLVQKYQVIAFEKVDTNKIKVALGYPAQLKTHPPVVLNELKEKKDMNIDLYITTPEDIAYVLKSELKTADLGLVRIPYEVISKFPIEISRKYKMVVFANPEPNIIRVAVSDPSDPKVQEILDFVREKKRHKDRGICGHARGNRRFNQDLLSKTSESFGRRGYRSAARYY